MIFGITLKRFAKLQAAGENVKCSKRTLRLIEKKSNKIWRTNDIMEMKVSDYVDLEIYFEELDYVEFCRIFVKRSIWEIIYISHMWKILEDFNNQRNKMYEKFYYIFNPPVYGDPGQSSLGSELKEDFVKEFGNWVVLTDRICKGKLVDYKVIENWKMSEFLFWANYLTGQQIVEKVK